MKHSKALYLFFMIWFIPIAIFSYHFFNISNFISTLLLTSTLKTVLFTSYQACISTLLALALALLPSIYAGIKNNRLSRLLSSTLFIPFFFPVISATTTFALIGHTIIFQNLHFLFSLKAIIIANVFFNAPIFIYYIKEVLKKAPRTLQDLSEIDGLDSKKFFFKVLIPFICPAIIKASVLCFAYSFTNFGIILNLGGLKYSTLEVSIATTLLSSFNFSTAMTYGLIQLIILSILFFLVSKHSASEYEIDRPITFKISLPIFCVSCIFLLFEYSIVIISVILSFFNFYTGNFSYKAIKEIFSLSFNSTYPIWISFFNSILLSVITAVLTLILVYFIIKKRGRFTNFYLFSTLGISNAFLSICLIYLNILYQIPIGFLLIIGYCIIATPIAFAFVSPHFESFPKNVLENAKISGANALQVFLYIEWPLLKPIILATFLQIFTIIFGEFTLTYTMQIYSSLPTLAITSYMLSSSHHLFESGALSAISVIFVIIIYLFSLTFISIEKK